jgi:hypothetical protein
MALSRMVLSKVVLIKMPLSKMALSRMVHGKVAISRMALDRVPLGKMALSKKAFGRMTVGGLFTIIPRLIILNGILINVVLPSQEATQLHNIRPKSLERIKHSSLFVRSISDEKGFKKSSD